MKTDDSGLILGDSSLIIVACSDEQIPRSNNPSNPYFVTVEFPIRNSTNNQNKKAYCSYYDTEMLRWRKDGNATKSEKEDRESYRGARAI